MDRVIGGTTDMYVAGVFHREYTLVQQHITELGRRGDMFGDCLCVDCVNLLCINGHNKLTNTKFTRPCTNILKSTVIGARMSHRKWRETKEQLI